MTIFLISEDKICITNGSDVNEFENDSYFAKRGAKIGYQGLEKDGNNSINYSNFYFNIKRYYQGEEEPSELLIFSDQITETTSGYSFLTFYISFVLLAGSYLRDVLSLIFELLKVFLYFN